MNEWQLPLPDNPERVALIDLIDHLLDQGVVLHGELTLGLAGVDLVVLEVSALLAAADRVLAERGRGE